MNLRPVRILVVSAMVLGFGLWLTFTSYQQLREASILQQEGLQTLATVAQKWIVPGETRNNSHRIRYTFPVAEGDQTFERSVPLPLYRVVESGSTFEVTVSPGNPALHEIFPGQLAGRARSRLTGGLFVFLIGVALFFLQGGMGLLRPKT